MINVHFYTSGAYNLHATGCGKELDYTDKHCSLDMALARAQRFIEEEDFLSVDVVDANTGELIATLCAGEDRFTEDLLDDVICNPYEEMGYNPYLGCYDWDC